MANPDRPQDAADEHGPYCALRSRAEGDPLVCTCRPPAPGRDDTTGAGDESASYGVSVESANPQVRTVVRPMSEVVTLAALARRGFEGKSSWMDAADAILAAGWTPPAATPGRDELREQIAAALLNPWAVACPNCGSAPRVACTRMADGTVHPRRLADAVMEPVDAWVAAHTAEAEALDRALTDMTDEVERLRDEVSRYRKDFWVLSGQRDKARAAVARVRALCDDAERLHKNTPAANVRIAAALINDIRAALPPTTEGD